MGDDISLWFGFAFPSWLVVQTVKRLPTMQEAQVRFLGGEDPLEKEMAPHSSTLAWKIPWTEVPGGLHPWGCKESDTTEQLPFHNWRCWVTFHILAGHLCLLWKNIYSDPLPIFNQILLLLLLSCRNSLHNLDICPYQI